jgi:hypothetical protein
MPGSFLTLDRHSGFYNMVSLRKMHRRMLHTFLASFFCLRCFAAECFSILLRSRTGTRFDLGSKTTVSM